MDGDDRTGVEQYDTLFGKSMAISRPQISAHGFNGHYSKVKAFLATCYSQNRNEFHRFYFWSLAVSPHVPRDSNVRVRPNYHMGENRTSCEMRSFSLSLENCHVDYSFTMEMLAGTDLPRSSRFGGRGRRWRQVGRVLVLPF